MNSTRHAVCDFDIQFGNDIFLKSVDVSKKSSEKMEGHTRVDAGIANISDGSTFDHVSHRETLDRLILPDAARAIRATHEFDMTTAFLVATTISSFLCL